jgi:hypothetical protein
MTNRLGEIRAALLAALPEGGNALHSEEVSRLAELRLAAELLRAKLINGRRTDVEKLIRLEGLVNRLSRSLGLDRPPKPAPVKFPWIACRKPAG